MSDVESSVFFEAVDGGSAPAAINALSNELDGSATAHLVNLRNVLDGMSEGFSLMGPEFTIL